MNDKISIAKYANNKNIWLNVRDAFPYPYTEKDAEEFITKHSPQNPPTTLAIEYSYECVGVIGFVPQIDIYSKTAELGYWLGEPFWNKKIITTAVKNIVPYFSKF